MTYNVSGGTLNLTQPQLTLNSNLWPSNVVKCDIYFVCPSVLLPVCHTRESRLYGSRYRNIMLFIISQNDVSTGWCKKADTRLHCEA